VSDTYAWYHTSETRIVSTIDTKGTRTSWDVSVGDDSIASGDALLDSIIAGYSTHEAYAAACYYGEPLHEHLMQFWGYVMCFDSGVPIRVIHSRAPDQTDDTAQPYAFGLQKNH